MQAADSIPGWTLARTETTGPKVTTTLRKGSLEVVAQVTTHGSSELARTYNATVLTETNGAQFPLRSPVVEKIGLRLFELHEGMLGADGKMVLNPNRPFLARGALGTHTYYVTLVNRGDLNRSRMEAEFEHVLPLVIKSVVPSKEADMTTYHSMFPGRRP